MRKIVLAGLATLGCTPTATLEPRSAPIEAPTASEDARDEAISAWLEAHAEPERFYVPYTEADLHRGLKLDERGSEGAAVTIVVFLDYRSNFAAAIMANFEALLEAHAETVHLIVKPFALTDTAWAQRTARAVLAAAEQDRGWDMHARIVQADDAVSSSRLSNFAEQLGVADLERFETALHTDELEALVAKPGDRVEFHYIGELGDGTHFYDSHRRAEGFEAVLGEGTVIEGIDQGLEGARVGMLRKLVIPPELGYAERELADVPPNSTLIYYVEIMAVEPGEPPP